MRNDGGTSKPVKLSVKLMCNPTSRPDAVASAAARSESSMKTIALAALIRLPAWHSMIRSVACAERPRSSAFMVSIGVRSLELGGKRSEIGSQRLTSDFRLLTSGGLSHPGRHDGVTQSIEACESPRCSFAHLWCELLRSTLAPRRLHGAGTENGDPAKCLSRNRRADHDTRRENDKTSGVQERAAPTAMARVRGQC